MVEVAAGTEPSAQQPGRQLPVSAATGTEASLEAGSVASLGL